MTKKFPCFLRVILRYSLLPISKWPCSFVRYNPWEALISRGLTVQRMINGFSHANWAISCCCCCSIFKYKQVLWLSSTLLRKIIKPMARQRHPFICISYAPSLLEMTLKSFSCANYYDLSKLIPSETLFRDICVMRLKNAFLLKNYLKSGIFQNVLIV